MTLDRQRARELAQALIRARKMRNENGFLMNTRQSSTASGGRLYNEAPFPGTGFLSALRGTTAGDQATSPSQELVSTPRSLPFRDPASLSYVDEIDDLAKARGIPAQDQLAFNEAPSTSPRPENLQTTHGRPLALIQGTGLPQRYWGELWDRLFPPYCPPSRDGLTFPPLIYQDKAPLTEAEKDACHKQNDHDWEQCKNNYSYSREALQRCRERADIIRDLCLRGETETLPWSDEDEDGIKLPRPPKRRKRK